MEDLMMAQDLKACSCFEENFSTKYMMLNTLGKGHFSLVRLAFHVPTSTEVAVKILRNTKQDSWVSYREARIMKSLRHPNIIKLFDVVQRRETTYLVMEYASEGELQDLITQFRPLEESEARRMFVQILHAVQYCHDHHIVHRDIKARNVLIDCWGNPKLSDFGLAAEVIPGQKLASFCGTLPYCAPELFQEKEYEGLPMDIWSLGVLLFLMVAGTLPFRGRTSTDLRRPIIAANFSVPAHVPTDIFNLIIEMLTINPRRRPTIHQIMRRPMIRGSEVCSPPVSTQIFPGTQSPSLVRPMKSQHIYQPDTNVSSCNAQEELCGCLQALTCGTLTGSSSVYSWQKETLMEEKKLTREEAIHQIIAVIQEEPTSDVQPQDVGPASHCTWRHHWKG